MSKVKSLYIRTLSLLIRKAPKMIIYSVALTVITAVFPYVNIILSISCIIIICRDTCYF